MPIDVTPKLLFGFIPFFVAELSYITQSEIKITSAAGEASKGCLIPKEEKFYGFSRVKAVSKAKKRMAEVDSNEGVEFIGSDV